MASGPNDNAKTLYFWDYIRAEALESKIARGGGGWILGWTQLKLNDT
jgi:hypothetical protein